VKSIREGKSHKFRITPVLRIQALYGTGAKVTLFLPSVLPLKTHHIVRVPLPRLNRMLKNPLSPRLIKKVQIQGSAPIFR
jgi:hypothetical protein